MTMQKPDGKLLLAFYADDFTGSTDALECLTRAGLRCALFLETPTAERIARYPGLQAVGIAGRTRALAPAEMEADLRPAFQELLRLAPRHVHYKVCSTFDSSPTVGSIGRALEIGMEVFAQDCVPLLVAAPGLGRYTLFGNHFARLGAGTAGKIYRLDRHPAMSRHPVTPADESDLRLHLARQTQADIALFDLLSLELPEAQSRLAYAKFMAETRGALLFDGANEAHLRRFGQLVGPGRDDGKSCFSVGSSGVDTALCMHFAEEISGLRESGWTPVGEAKPLLVVSGSCSPVTGGQIDWALSQGFAGVQLDADKLASGEGFGPALEALVSAAGQGRHLIAYTNRGGDGRTLSSETSLRLGAQLGRLARETLGRTGIRRLVVAGGDSSSYAARALGIEAVEMLAPLSPGAPLCLARAPGSPADGREVNFKGGQVGAPNYFGSLAAGRLLP